MATIKDVAKMAGVSIATVSRVINKSPRASQSAIDAVTKAMSTLGYRPNAAAKALVSQNTSTVGVLVGDVSDPFFGMLVKTVDRVAHQHHKHTLVGNGYHDAQIEKDAIELLINNRCDALIIHAKGLSDAELIAYANEVKSLVIINRHIDALADRCISLDNFKGAYLATEHLLRHGHRHIAYIGSTHQIEDADQRLNGYRSALQDYQIELPNSYIAYGDPDSHGGELAMRELLTKSLNLTAVVAYNDYMAAGAMSIIHENGISIPDHISIMGFDDGMVAKYLYPRLSTIRYPIEMMAEKAANLAIYLAQGHPIEPEPMRFTPTIVNRNTVIKRS